MLASVSSGNDASISTLRKLLGHRRTIKDERPVLGCQIAGPSCFSNIVKLSLKWDTKSTQIEFTQKIRPFPNSGCFWTQDDPVKKTKNLRLELGTYQNKPSWIWPWNRWISVFLMPEQNPSACQPWHQSSYSKIAKCSSDGQLEVFPESMPLKYPSHLCCRGCLKWYQHFKIYGQTILLYQIFIYQQSKISQLKMVPYNWVQSLKEMIRSARCNDARWLKGNRFFNGTIQFEGDVQCKSPKKKSVISIVTIDKRSNH